MLVTKNIASLDVVCADDEELNAGIWEGLHWAFPEVVGGCRCQLLLPYLGPGWAVETDATVTGGLLSSQVLVACKRPSQSLC